jgi:hypothetical protein
LFFLVIPKFSVANRAGNDFKQTMIHSSSRWIGL